MTQITDARTTAAYHLVGHQLEDGWQAVSRLDQGFEHTGSNFSVGYKAIHTSGVTGFLKAIDYSAALDDDDPSTALAELTAQYNFERDVLRLCGDRKLRRVVRVLCAGKLKVPGHSPGTVNYLIFELADGDARDVVLARDSNNQVAMLRLAHDAAVAMAKLHSAKIFHQDVKPSNLLIWQDASFTRAKLADLGCAYVEGMPRSQDGLRIPGDVSYAPPEQLYRSEASLSGERSRQAADVFMLGNLICFLLIGVPYSAVRDMHLDSSYRWLHWGGTYGEALPALVEAHVLAMERLSSCLRESLREGVTGLIDQLCYPDPDLRGDPIGRNRGRNPYQLTRIVSRLDLLHRRASVRESVR